MDTVLLVILVSVTLSVASSFVVPAVAYRPLHGGRGVFRAIRASAMVFAALMTASIVLIISSPFV